MIRLHGQLPELEFFGCNGFLEALRERDLVEKPIGAGLVGDVFRAIGEEDASHQAVAMPLLAAAELRQLGAGEFGLCSWDFLSAREAAPLGPRCGPRGTRGLGGGRARRGGGSPGLQRSESRGYRVEGAALALKRRGAFQGSHQSRSWVRPCRIRKEMTMTGLNGEQAGGSVSRRGVQVAARLAALWCDSRLAVDLAGFVVRNGFCVVNLARRDDNPMRHNRRRWYHGACRSCRRCGCRPVSPQAA